MAAALTAWLTAPAPMAWTSALPCSRMTPAMAPATAEVRDSAETLMMSIGPSPLLAKRRSARSVGVRMVIVAGIRPKQTGRIREGAGGGGRIADAMGRRQEHGERPIQLLVGAPVAVGDVPLEIEIPGKDRGVFVDGSVLDYRGGGVAKLGGGGQPG